MGPEDIAASFSRMAVAYDAHAVIQRAYAQRLMVHLAAVGVPAAGAWVDVGSATGASAIPFCSLFSPRVLVALDLADRSLAILRERGHSEIIPVRADMVFPPLRPHAFDGVLMCSSLHWARDPVLALHRACASLRPGGLFAFSIFAQGNLPQLSALQAAYRIRVPVQYLRMDSLPPLLANAGMEVISLTEAVETESFPDAIAALRSISGIGAGVSANHLHPGQLRSFVAQYARSASRGTAVVNEYRALVGVARKKAPRA